MPNKNGTGPEGEGPKTGRGLGPCRDGVSKGDRRGLGLGRGRGSSTGRGFGRNVDNDSKAEK